MNHWTWTICMSFLFIAITSNAQQLKFEKGTWEQVKKIAKAAQKPIFVDVYTTWCEPCKWMDNNTFENKEVADFFATNYIAYKLNAEEEKALTLVQSYKVRAYPTLLYFDRNGELVHRLNGAFKAEELLEISKAALHPNGQLCTLQKRYKEGEREPAFLRQYIKILEQANEPYQAVVDVFIEKVNFSALSKAENFDFLEKYIKSDYKHPAYLYVVENRELFSERLTTKRVDKYLLGVLDNYCYDLIENAVSKSTLKVFLYDVKQLMPSSFNLFKARIDFVYNQNPKRDYQFAVRYEKYCIDSRSLNRLALYMLDAHSDDSNILQAALKWTNRAISIEESAYVLETKVKILMELGQKDKALETAKRQVEVSIRDNIYIKESKTLLEQLQKR